jgi:ABC-2 type transport system ATP-binding protein
MKLSGGEKLSEILKIEMLTKAYKGGKGIFDINFSVNKGEVFGLLGSNGSGKTTIMKIISGLIKTYKGNVFAFEKNIKNHHKEIIKKTGCCIESADLYQYMTGFDNLNLATKLIDINI